ncbi:hypothetical protein CORC01_00680 [Colletotrichum orchidophilum]|uniref:Uncharacterized protein n=1 Tax=Colletotrichum orchidophilum TaxID=1209926 RepID=A0A1G4BR45_9PEZI|nr:uncharacterized protein CORC01_00680 [Colletotrichum orchidophilum]OHF03818.1 hypothetical protein CORC01_00680 [Colletotrichum orchidophilum]
MSSQPEDTQGCLDIYPASYFIPVRHGSKRPVKVAGYTLRALAETCRSEERYHAAREAAVSIIHVLEEEIEMLRVVGSTMIAEQRYLDGWEDSLITVIGVLNHCIVRPTTKSSPRPHPEAAQQLETCSPDPVMKTWEEPCSLHPPLHLEIEEEVPADFKGKAPIRFEDMDVPSLSPPRWQSLNQRDRVPDLWHDAIAIYETEFPKSTSSESTSIETASSAVSTPLTTGIESSARNLLTFTSPLPPFPSSQATESFALIEEEQTPSTSEIIRGIDTIQLLLHYERQSRISERKIAAELTKASVLRQAIFQDRFLGQVPKFGGVDSNDVEDTADDMNNPTFGETVYERARRQVTALFRRWSGTSWQSDTQEAGSDVDVVAEDASTQTVGEREGSVGEGLVDDDDDLGLFKRCGDLDVLPPDTWHPCYQPENLLYQPLSLSSPDSAPDSGGSENTFNPATYSPSWLQPDQANLTSISQKLSYHVANDLCGVGFADALSESRPFEDDPGDASHGVRLAAPRANANGYQGRSAELPYPLSPQGPSHMTAPWGPVCRKGRMER